MLQTITGLAANRSIFANEINAISGGKVKKEHNNKNFVTGFFTSRAQLAYAK